MKAEGRRQDRLDTHFPVKRQDGEAVGAVIHASFHTCAAADPASRQLYLFISAMHTGCACKWSVGLLPASICISPAAQTIVLIFCTCRVNLSAVADVGISNQMARGLVPALCPPTCLLLSTSNSQPLVLQHGPPHPVPPHTHTHTPTPATPTHRRSIDSLSSPGCT